MIQTKTDIEGLLDKIRQNCVIMSDYHKKRYLYLKEYLKVFKIPIINKCRKHGLHSSTFVCSFFNVLLLIAKCRRAFFNKIFLIIDSISPVIYWNCFALGHDIKESLVVRNCFFFAQGKDVFTTVPLADSINIVTHPHFFHRFSRVGLSQMSEDCPSRTVSAV